MAAMPTPIRKLHQRPVTDPDSTLLVLDWDDTLFPTKGFTSYVKGLAKQRLWSGSWVEEVDRKHFVRYCDGIGCNSSTGAGSDNGPGAEVMDGERFRKGLEARVRKGLADISPS